MKSNTNTQIYPNNWFEVNLNSVVNVNPESLGIGTPQDFEFHYIDISSVTSGVINWETVTIQRFKSSPSRARRVINSNDVLLCTVRPRLQAHAFAYWKEPNNYIGSTGFAVLRANKSINPRFLYHLIFSEIVAKQLRQQEVGSNYPAVNEADVRALRIPLPSLIKEQQKIAEILDTVDKAIALTQTHISKLKLAKAGLLHDLLTRGIDEHGELRNPTRNPEQFKDSPLGRIPKDWDVVKLENLIERITSGSRGWARYYSDFGAIFLRIGNLSRETLNLRLEDIVYVSPPSGSEGERTKVQPGDILISITADIGIIGVISNNFGEAYVNQHIALIRINYPEINHHWIGLFLSQDIGQKQFRKFNDSGAKAGINLPTIASIIVALPNYKEQCKIVSIINHHDNQITSKQTRLEKLKLVKKGLMSDLLTGKVRVKI